MGIKHTASARLHFRRMPFSFRPKSGEMTQMHDKKRDGE
jgi:hypothetical protein